MIGITCHPDHRPTCAYRPVDGPRCGVTAAGMLYAPDGTPCPGCALCDQHATAVIDEYLEKLGERWALRRYVYGDQE